MQKNLNNCKIANAIKVIQSCQTVRKLKMPIVWLLLKSIPIITLTLSINMFGADTQQCLHNWFYLSRENRKKEK